MKKKCISWLVSMTMAAALLAGCGAAPEEAPSPEPAQESQAQEAEPEESSDTAHSSDLSFNIWCDASAVIPEFDTLWADFMAEKYPDYNWDLKVTGIAGGDRATEVTAAINTNSLPDMSWFPYFTTTDWMHEGYYVDMSDVVEAHADQINAAALGEANIGGSYYVLPVIQDHIMMMYNVDIMEAAGLGDYVAEENKISVWTVDEFETVLAGLADNLKGTEKFPLSLWAGNEQADTMTLNLLNLYGGGLWKDGFSAAGESKEVADALNQLITYMNNGWTNSDVVTKLATSWYSDFCNQTSAITFCQYTSYVTLLKDQESGAVEEFQIRLLAIPQSIDGKDTYTATSYMYGASMFQTNNEEKQAICKEFLDWICSDNDRILTITTGYPAFNDLTSNETVLAANPYYKSFAELLTDGHTWVFNGTVPGYSQTRATLYPELQAAFGGNKSAEDALKSYQDAANAVIQEYTDNSLILN